MNKQSLTQSRVTNILEVAKREDLLHVVISTQDLKEMQNMLLDLQAKNKELTNNTYGLQIKLNAAEERDELKGRTIDSLKAKLNQSEQNVGVLLAKLVELGETVFAEQFGRGLRTFKENPVFSINTPHGPITATEAEFKRLYQGEWKPEETPNPPLTKAEAHLLWLKGELSQSDWEAHSKGEVTIRRNPYAKALDAKPKQADENQPPWEKKRQQAEQKQAVSVGNIQPVRFCVLGLEPAVFTVADFTANKNLPFNFITKEEAETLAAVLNSFVTKE